MDVLEVARRARSVALRVAKVSGETKNKAILAIAELVDRQKAQIKEANSDDIRDASKTCLTVPLTKRLRLDDAKIGDLTAGLRLLAQLKDPLGEPCFPLRLITGLNHTKYVVR